jgi:dTDP-D-glucose 4,6-dehydratase
VNGGRASLEMTRNIWLWDQKQAGLRRTVYWYREQPEWRRPLRARLTRESSGFWTDA